MGCQTNSNKNHTTNDIPFQYNTTQCVWYISFSIWNLTLNFYFELASQWIPLAKTKIHYTNVLLFVVGNYRELIEYLNGTSDLLAKNGNILDNVLETLDVQQHSLGVLYVLVAKFTNLSVCCCAIHEINFLRPACIELKCSFPLFCVQNSSTEGENVIRLVREFIQSCNGEQARHAPQACE